MIVPSCPRAMEQRHGVQWRPMHPQLCPEQTARSVPGPKLAAAASGGPAVAARMAAGASLLQLVLSRRLQAEGRTTAAVAPQVAALQRPGQAMLAAGS